MEEKPSLNMPVQRLKVAILPLDLPCSGPVTHSGEILTTGKSHGKKPDRSLKMIFSYCLLDKILRHKAINRAPKVCSELKFTCLIIFKTERSASALTLRFVLERYLVRTWPMLTTTLIEVSRDFS
jgi:hypothetical protein